MSIHCHGVVFNFVENDGSSLSDNGELLGTDSSRSSYDSQGEKE